MDIVSKQFVALLRAEIDTALGAVVDNNPELKTLKLGRISYDSNGFTAKVECTFAGGKSKEEQYYESERSYHREMPPLGSVIVLGGERHKVVGATRTGRVIIQRLRDDARLIVRGNGSAIIKCPVVSTTPTTADV